MIKPIETKYAGCRFRSRLEARWAVYFDTFWCHNSGNNGWYEDLFSPTFALQVLGINAGEANRKTSDGVNAARSARFEFGESG